VNSIMRFEGKGERIEERIQIAQVKDRLNRANQTNISYNTLKLRGGGGKKGVS